MLDGRSTGRTELVGTTLDAVPAHELPSGALDLTLRVQRAAAMPSDRCIGHPVEVIDGVDRDIQRDQVDDAVDRGFVADALRKISGPVNRT